GAQSPPCPVPLDRLADLAAGREADAHRSVVLTRLVRPHLAPLCRRLAVATLQGLQNQSWRGSLAPARGNPEKLGPALQSPQPRHDCHELRCLKRSGPQALRRLRPLARRWAMTLRPPA